jgi:hypothetical protein
MLSMTPAMSFAERRRKRRLRRPAPARAGVCEGAALGAPDARPTEARRDAPVDSPSRSSIDAERMAWRTSFANEDASSPSLLRRDAGMTAPDNRL